jgi:hypothetical protein
MLVPWLSGEHMPNNAFFKLTLGAFHNSETLASLHLDSAHLQDYLHGLPLLPKQGLGAQSGTQVWDRSV